MIAHTPTIFASVALVAMIMAFCLILVGNLHRRDGMLTVGAGLVAHALAYVCYTLYGHGPLWLTYAVANSLLSLALAFYAAGILHISGRPVPWWRILSPAALMLVVLLALLDTREPRMLAACAVLIGQCLVIIRWARRHAQPEGRAHLLLIIGGAISLVGVLVRVVAIVTGNAPDMAYGVSNLKQTVSVSIGTVTVMMLSLGLVLLAKERSEAALSHAALRDTLTGVPNRRAILEQLESELERARRGGTALAIGLLDIDHFKSINDRHGHLAGDEVLCLCAHQLRQRLRQSDGFGRYGGEEFLLFLPGATPEGAAAAVDALRRAVAEHPARIGELVIPLTFSAGLWCGVPGQGQKVDDLIALADRALYAAKAAGRNTVRLADDGPAPALVPQPA